MTRSRRPELEKDKTRSDERNRLGETLQILTDTAERFVNGVPRWKKKEADRQALLDAITQAQLVLSVRRVSLKRPSR